MQLTITNTGTEDQAIGSPDGAFVDVLQPGVGKSVSNEAEVLIIGDKPSVRDQFARAGAILAATARAIYDAIMARQEQARASANVEPVETITVSISNHGSNPVRVTLGDGVTDITVDAGATSAASAPGYIELRELGTLDESQKDGGDQPVSA